MQTTPYYRLPQWQAYEKLLHKDLNQTIAKIDAALQTIKASGDASIQALRATVTANQNSTQQTLISKCQMAFGTYSGTHIYQREIALPFTPSVLFVETSGGMRSDDGETILGGIAIAGYNLMFYQKVGIEIIENGFRVHHNLDNKILLNYANRIYHYVAFR